jgi:hypothetical protein
MAATVEESTPPDMATAMVGEFKTSLSWLQSPLSARPDTYSLAPGASFLL